jgi:hypothetical protein
VVLNELRDQSKPITVRHLSQETLKKSVGLKKKPKENKQPNDNHAVSATIQTFVLHLWKFNNFFFSLHLA